MCFVCSNLTLTLSPFFFAELKATFEMFDKDKDGHISVNEVKAVVSAIGDTPNTERIEAMFKQVDLDG